MENFSIEELIKNKKPQSRTFKELAPVLKEPEKEQGPDDKIIYDMYRDLSQEKDRDMIKRHGLRYDITVIYPNKLERELTKTYGHYHKDGMMEITEVISGKAWFLLQKYATDPRTIKEAYLVYVNEGEKIVYPPGFGHITINPEKDKELVTSNWISPKTESEYGPYQNLQGACYYFSRNEKDEFSREENRKYKDTPELVRLIPNEIPELKITFDRPLYSLIETPGKLEFLNNPEKYTEIFTINRGYTKI